LGVAGGAAFSTLQPSGQPEEALDTNWSPPGQPQAYGPLSDGPRPPDGAPPGGESLQSHGRQAPWPPPGQGPGQAGAWPPPGQEYGAPSPWLPPGEGYGGYWPPRGGPGSPPGAPFAPPKGPTTGPLNLPLHPMNLADVMDTAFRLLRARFRSIAVVLGVVVVPVHLISALATRNAFNGTSFLNVFHNAAHGVQTTQTSVSTNSLTAITALLSWIVLPFAAGAISILVAGSYTGTEVTAGRALRAAGRRWLPLLVATIVVHLLEVIGVFLLVLPGFLVMSLSVAVSPAIVVERLGPLRGIRRSWQLDRHRLWGILGIALLTGLIFTIAGGIVSTPLELIGFAVGLHWGWVLVFLASVLSSVFSVALSAIVATLIYFDGRIRTEGFDLEVLAGRLGR